MTYQEWFDTHASKHATLMAKLSHLSTTEVIEYFRFENMVDKEADFCLLYANNKKCHESEYLNCYLCACPYFRFNDAGLALHEGKILYSTCSLNLGDQFISDNAIHHDCTRCEIPHSEKLLHRLFERSWTTVMQKVSQNTLK
jgi:Zn-finger protein